MTFKKNPRHAIRQYGVKLDKHKLFNRNKPKEFWREVNKFIPGKQQTPKDAVNTIDVSLSHNQTDNQTGGKRNTQN